MSLQSDRRDNVVPAVTVVVINIPGEVMPEYLYKTIAMMESSIGGAIS